jgi:hypothetical protein
MALHEQPSSELKRQVAEGSLSPKKKLELKPFCVIAELRELASCWGGTL